MPIHSDWISMLKDMAKRYKTGARRCYAKAGGGKICAPAKAWSVFYAKVTQDYGRGAYTKPRTKVSESEETYPPFPADELERDIMMDWYLKDQGLIEEDEE